MNGLKKRLDDANGKWVEELPLSCGHIEPHLKRQQRTPFLITYGAEAIIPLETGFPTLRTSSFNPSSNNELREKNLDIIVERRESAMVQLAYYQYKLK